MKKNFFSLFIIAIVTSVPAFADAGKVSCGKGKQTIELRFEEMSELTKNSVTLHVGEEKNQVEKIKVSETDYGVLGIDVQVGKGPGKYIYYFENLGTKRCFSVYESGQKGPAKVRVVNSLGVVGRFDCKCEVD